MLRQASMHQLRAGVLEKGKNHVVIAMAFHPRGLETRYRDEYVSALAPDRLLFKEWKEQEKKVGHERAFAAVRYEERFELAPEAIDHLRRLASLGKVVYLVCQCAIGERCHREMLLLAAKEILGASIGHIYHEYPQFQARLSKLASSHK